MDVHHRVAQVVASIKPLRPLAHHDCYIRDGAFIGQMMIVLGEPVEVLAARFVPSAVGAQAIFPTNKVIPGTMPLATVSSIHICASCVDLWIFLQRGFPVE